MVPYRTDLIHSVISRTSFGIWDLLNAGSDPFGAPTRPKIQAEDAIALLGKLGVPRISLHDLDVGMDPWVTPDAQALDARLAVLKKALGDVGLRVWMYTPCLFHHPLVRAGSVTSNDARVRRMSLAKIIYSLDVAQEFGASWVTFWLGRDGSEVDALIDAKAAYERIADAVGMAAEYIRKRGYDLKISLEPKPNEPRGDIYVSTVGTAMGIINMLPEADRALVGVNPELLQHEGMAGLNAYHALGQLVAANKLAFLHLGGQTPLRYDQDHPFLGGNSDLKASFYIALAVVKHAPECVLEFDCHPFRTEAAPDAREEFVLANLEALGMMMDKAKSFLAIPEVQQLLADTESRGFGMAATPSSDLDAFLQQLKAGANEVAEVTAQLNPHAQYLDRLVNLHLLGYL
ncbi:MAG: TIM barrel protein [Armatimonadota bacterium]